MPSTPTGTDKLLRVSSSAILEAINYILKYKILKFLKSIICYRQRYCRRLHFLKAKKATFLILILSVRLFEVLV